MGNPEVDGLVEMLRGRYGGRLSDEQLAELGKEVEAASDRARRMRAVRLGNGDEPAFAFRPFRGDD